MVWGGSMPSLLSWDLVKREESLGLLSVLVVES